jgi:hypothetical protein
VTSIIFADLNGDSGMDLGPELILILCTQGFHLGVHLHLHLHAWMDIFRGLSLGLQAVVIGQASS